MVKLGANKDSFSPIYLFEDNRSFGERNFDIVVKIIS